MRATRRACATRRVEPSAGITPLMHVVDGRARSADGRARSGIYRLRDDVDVPLICPTCQNVFAGPPKASMRAPPLFCMGLFSIFLSGGSASGLRLSQDGLPSRSSRPPSPFGLRRGSLRSLRSERSRAGLPSRSSRSERRLVGPADSHSSAASSIWLLSGNQKAPLKPLRFLTRDYHQFVGSVGLLPRSIPRESGR